MTVLIWDRPEPRSRPGGAPLRRSDVVRAAVQLADRDGLDAVSIRNVAHALDVRPMRIYSYAPAKQDLLDLMIDAVYGRVAARIDRTPAAATWQAAVHVVAGATRTEVLRHDWAAQLWGGRPALGPNTLAVLERGAEAVAGAPGLDDVARLQNAIATVNAYVAGAVRREIGERHAAAVSGVSKAAWRAATGPYLQRAFAGRTLPTVERVVRDGPAVTPADSFVAGLDLILAGIAAGP